MQDPVTQMSNFRPGFQECFAKKLNSTAQMIQQGIEVSRMCPTVWDSITCWPYALPNTTVHLPCMPFLNGVPYTVDQNVTRFCGIDGQWVSKSDYSACSPVIGSIESMVGGDSADITPDITTAENVATLYLLGYSTSTVALGIGLYIFTQLKDLRCVRNTIHKHLMLTYLLVDMCWLLGAFFQMVLPIERNGISCFVFLVYHFFHIANFTWMFVEGLYLYLLVVKTFYVEKIKLRLYMFIGWGTPLPVTVMWLTLRYIVAAGGERDTNHNLIPNCPWLEPSPWDWLHKGPVMGILAVNSFFLIHVMVVLIKKLRTTAAIQFQSWFQQVSRALRSLLVLMPLLGSPYVIMLLVPTRGSFAVILAYVRAIVFSMPGLVVTVIYCFLNSEVQESISNHVDRWKSIHEMPHGSQGSCAVNNAGNNAQGVATSVRLMETDTVVDAMPMRLMQLPSSSNSGGDVDEGNQARCSINLRETIENHYDPLPVFPPLFPKLPHSPKPELLKSPVHCSSPSMLSRSNSGSPSCPQASEFYTVLSPNITPAITSLPTSSTTATSRTSSPVKVPRVFRQITIANSQDLLKAREEIMANS